MPFSEAGIFNISGDETGASISLARNGSLDREKLSSITLVIMVGIYFYILVTDTSLSHSIIIVQGTKQIFIPHATSCGGYNVFDPSVSQSVSPSVLFFLLAQLL